MWTFFSNKDFLNNICLFLFTNSHILLNKIKYLGLTVNYSKAINDIILIAL